MFIEPIAAFTDNYIWCLHDGSAAWVVDPGEAPPVQAFLAAKKLNLQGILITHHHHDHTGGIGELRQAFPALSVYGPHNPGIEGLDNQLAQGMTVDVLGYSFAVLEIPGHTLDHIAYFAASSHPPTLFCGDTLFAAGCGRLFEGTPPQMLASLQKLAQLPAATAVYCGHEYTVANLRFAQAVEPDNVAVRERAAAAAILRAAQRPTLPSSIGMELATNPFLRCHTPPLLAAARQHGLRDESLTAIFTVIRGWKDQF